MNATPISLNIRPLEKAEWQMIAETYESEFDNKMPETEAQSAFYGIFLDDEMVGFYHIEACFHLNAVYLQPEHRNKNLIAGAFDFIEAATPRGFPMLIMPDANVTKLIESFGFHELPDTKVFRRDF